MLPLWLSLENFGSYRARVAIDFADAGYFALVGPTGAGKSTIVDAICFALYGSVPRWGRENVVSLALAPSASTGKVALVFEATGRRYGAVRVLTRTRKGQVQTREARLDELDPAVSPAAGIDGLLRAGVNSLAEGEGVIAAVEEIIGLPYKYFAQSVVVPQGRFAEFLHAPPRERQDLLVRLLDAGVYERVRQRAAAEEEAARQAVTVARQQLDALTDADAESERRAAERLATLTSLAETVRSELDAMIRADEDLRLAREHLAGQRERLATLTRLAIPPGVAELGERIRAAEQDAARLAEEITAWEAAESAAERELAEAGDPGMFEKIIEGYAEHTRLTGELGRKENRLAEVSEEAAELADRLDEADRELARELAELDRARDAEAAAHLAGRLTVGEPCPVCLRAVEHVPAHPAEADLAALQTRVGTSRHVTADLERRHRDAETLLAGLRRECQDIRAQRADLSAVLDELPDRLAAEQQLKFIEAAGERARSVRTTARNARRAGDAAALAAAALRREADHAWRTLEQARDTVVALAPPSLGRDDPAAAWGGLLAWRDEAVPRQRTALNEATAGVARADREVTELRRSALARLAAAGVPAPEGTPMDINTAVTEAAAGARAGLERVRENRRRAAALAERAERSERDARVAHDLALLLRANNFEKWLCAEVLGLLVGAAAEILRELSGGQYELALGDRDEIEIIDCWEAGRRRSARTLSGGETFQAGLALALALSEQVAGFAAAAARSLDAIFLDEGFGTLDAAALDTVAATLERVAASDRMVGIVTHVPALAERVPVRYEVTRDAAGSRVRKITP